MWQDAVVELLRLRSTWSDHKAEHLTIDEQERLVCAWVRLRLIDKYETQWNRSKRTVALPDGTLLVDPKTARPPTLCDTDFEQIRAVAAKLKGSQAIIVQRLIFEGKTQEQVGAELGMTQPTISQTFERARRTMRKHLADYAGEIR